MRRERQWEWVQHVTSSGLGADRLDRDFRVRRLPRPDILDGFNPDLAVVIRGWDSFGSK